MKELTGDHAFVHEHMAAYLAGGLEAGVREQFDAHINNCPECFDAFSEARDADRALQRTLGTFVPDAKLEDHIISHVREHFMNRWQHPVLRRAAYATAAAIALAASGVFANFAMRQDGRFNNPLTRQLAAQADSAAPELARPADWVAAKFSFNHKSAAGATVNTEKHYAMNYVDARLDDILSDFGKTFGFIVVKNVQTPQRVTIQNPNPVTADEAVQLLNSALLTQGYGTIQSKTDNTPNAKTILRIASIQEAKKSLIPVRTGADPSDIPLSDSIITQVIPLKNVDAASLRKDLASFISSDADVTVNAGSNTLVVTDTSAKIHRLAEVIQSLDSQRSIKTVIEYRQLTNANAGEAAKLLNGMFSPPSGARGGSGGAGAGPNGRLYADFDARTNTVVLNGPADQTAQAVDMLNRLESIPMDVAAKSFLAKSDPAQSAQQGGQPSQSNDTFFIQHLKNGPAQTPPQSVGTGVLAYNEKSGPLDRMDKITSTNGDDMGFQFGVNGNQRAGVDANGNAVASGGAASANDGKLGTVANAGDNYIKRAIPTPINGISTSSGNIIQAERYSTVVTDTNSKQVANSDRWVGGVTSSNVNAPTFAARQEDAPAAADKLNESKTDGLKGAYDVLLAPTVHATVRDDTKSGTAEDTKLTPTAVAPGKFSDQGTFLSLTDEARLSTEERAAKAKNEEPAKLAAADPNGPIAIINGQPVNQAAGDKLLASLSQANNSTDHLIPYADLLVSPTDWPEIQRTGTVADGTAAPSGGLLTNPTLGARYKIPDSSAASTNYTPAKNGQNVGFGDAHAEFYTYWYNITDLGVLYDKKVGDPKINIADSANVGMTQIAWSDPTLLAAVTPVAPATPPTATGTALTRPAAPMVDPAASLKIIRNGTIEFEVLSFDDAYRRITTIAAAERGFVASTSSQKLANGHVRGTIVVRVPPDNVDDFLKSLRALGDLKAQQIGAADVTKQYNDIESELRGLVVIEARIQELIKVGNPLKDLIEAEKQLGDVQIRIEKLKGEINYYNNLVTLATITITAYEKDIQSPTAASEQESVNVNVETEEVEAKYKSAREIFDTAKARIVESQLKNSDAEHVAAHIVADVPPAQADFVANQLKQLGKVASFNRDRRQTTTGGTGAPIPGVQVEQKDTRFTIDLFNLANLAPRETTVLQVAVRDVEISYKNILALVKPVPAAMPDGVPASQPAGAAALTGRVISSNLSGQLPEQKRADIRAEVRTDNADAILGALRASGEVLASSLNTNQDNAGTTSAKRGIQVTLVNIASVGAKDIDNITIAVRDVDAAYNKALGLIRKDAPAPAVGAGVPAGVALLPPTVGRVLSASMNGQQPVQAAADIRAEIRVDLAAELLATLRASGEILNSTATENPETLNVTRAKRGLSLRFVNVAAINPRENQELHGVAANVADSYRNLLVALQDLALKGDVRILNSSLTDTDPRTVNANLRFEAQKTAVDAVEKAFTAAGLEFPARMTTRAPESSGTLDSKVGYQITEIKAVEMLDPKRIITQGVEVDNVERAVGRLRSSLTGLGVKVRESDYNVTHDATTGRVTAHIILDTYVSATNTVLNDIDNLGGLQKNYQETRNAQAPETKTFTKERIDLQLTSRSLIVQPDQGLGSSFRAALTSAAGALFLALYYILTGLLFLVPFTIIVWPIWTLHKRRKTRAQ